MPITQPSWSLLGRAVFMACRLAASFLAKAAKAKAKKRPWPKTLSEQAAAVQSALGALAAPADAKAVAACFSRARKERIAELLETLESLGRARRTDDGRYVAA